MSAVLMLFTIQCLLGGFDNLWHHELQAKLPQQPQARAELALHASRELLYALILAGIAWRRWEGAWTYVLVAVLAAELVITIWDFLVEDRTRRLPPLERVLHTLLALNYGALLALWAPQLQRWAAAPTGFAAVDYGVWSWLLTAFGVGVFAWGLRDLYAVARLGVPQWQRHPMRAGVAVSPRSVLVTGATGFIGRALVRRLVERGDEVLVLSRNPALARDRFGPLVEVVGTLAEIDRERRIDAIVNLAGEPVAGGLWTRRRKQLLLQSRLGVTTEVTALIRRLRSKPEVLVSASAIGWYGDRGDEILDETSGAQACFMSELCRRWEEAAYQATREGVRVCRLRIGLVLGAGGGVLQPMALATRLAGGSVFGDGRQWLSWIHLQDLLRLVELAMGNEDLHGSINAVAPVALPQAAFAAALARALRRPLLWRMPAALLRVATGDLADLFLISQRVEPCRALAAGFGFEFPEVERALADILGRNAEHIETAAAVYVNDRCPVCRAEMASYEMQAAGNAVAMEFCPIDARANGLAPYGLGEIDLRRRLFARMENGELCSGVDAFIAIWNGLPRLRRAARLLRLPGVYQVCNLLYDLVCAPLLSRWNERRLGTRPGAELRR